MTEDELNEIRARDMGMHPARMFTPAEHDRRALLHAYDALRSRLADSLKAEECVGLQRDKAERRLAEAERNEETLLGMIRHQRDVLRECLPYINESMAGRRPGRSADDIRAAVKALTSDSADDVINAQHDETGRTWRGPRSQLPRRYFEITSICCLDYPLCDCNSPPEPDDDWLCFQRPAQPKVTP